MPKVWVVNYAGHNYEPAESFGEIGYLSHGYVSMGNLERLFYSMVESVRETDNEDYLLLSGLLLLNAIAAIAWLERHGKAKMLSWDKKLGAYRVLVVTKDQVAKLFDVLTLNEAEEKWQKNEAAGM